MAKGARPIPLPILSGRITEEMGFLERVWAMTARIPKGRVTTYGELARAVGSKGYRAVGMAMNRNPYAPDVPCHRVVGSDGKLTGYAGGLDTKRRMLKSEGVAFAGDRVDLARCLFRFGEPPGARPCTEI